MRGPRIALALLCGLILVVASRYQGHSVESMDVRTYAQMIRGVADHGLPSWDNGPIDRFPELVVQWGIPVHGRVWGIYGLLYPYLSALVFRLGGLERVSGFTFGFLAPLSLATFLLARRVVRSEWTAAAAAVLVVVSTPIAAKSLEITPFGLIAVLATFGLWLTVRLVQTRTSETPAALAASSGVVWAAASASHAVCFPMALAALALLGVAPEPGEALSFSAAELPDALGRARRRLAPALAGFAIAIAPIALVNRIRFGSLNPISYGPIPWTGLVNEELFKMTLGHQLRYSAPPAAVILVGLVLLFFARRSRRAQIVVGVATVLVLVLEPHLRERMLRYALVAWGDLVDMSAVDMGPAYKRLPDGLGRVFGGWVVKSTLQCTPLLALAPLALARDPGSAPAPRWDRIAILVPCAALYASLITRANLVYADAIGWPWVYIRYVFPALPGLLVAALVVVERLRPGRLEVSVAGALGVALAVAYVRTENDLFLAKRVTLLVAPLVVGALAFVFALRARMVGAPSTPLGRALAMITISLGVASGLGHDLRANVDGKRGCDSLVDKLNGAMPPRFALVGALGGFDVLLTSAATHDVEYADMMRLHDYKDLRPLLEYWRDEHRPIYMIWPSEPWSPWPDVRFTKVPVPDLYLLELGR